VTALTEWASKQRLGDMLPRPIEALTTTVEEAIEVQQRVAAPVVAKASGISHKSDRSLVRHDLDAEALRACWADLAESGDGTVLVAQQVRGELELLVGGSRDEQFGALVTIGLGGVTAEIDPDVVSLLVPVEPGELERAIRRLRAAPLFFGFRGRAAVDLDRLGRVVDAVARLLVTDPTVEEVDCNPVVIAQGRAVVLDALVVVSEDGGVRNDQRVTG
jgi:acetyl-CoA synthetase (ADP-forming)